MNRVARGILLPTVLLLVSCGSNPTSPSSPSVTPPAPTLPTGSRLEVQPPFFVFVGEEDQARAIAFVPLQAVDVSSQSEWQSSNPGVVSVSSTGQVIARSVGVTQLTAKYQGLLASSALAVSQDSDVQSVTIQSCGGSILVGMTNDCAAVVRVTGVSVLQNIADKASWSSTDASVVAVSAGGHVRAVAPGQARLSATYHGQIGTMSFVVTQAEQDALTISGGSSTGLFRPGNTVRLGLDVVYSVVSANTGQLVLRAYDQTALIGASAVTSVPRGSNSLFLSTTVTIPPSSTQVCWAAYLTVGGDTFVSPADPQDPRGAICGRVSQ